VIIGGHSIRNPEPIYGLAVTGVVDIRCMTTNANARPGDLLVLTKTARDRDRHHRDQAGSRFARTAQKCDRAHVAGKYRWRGSR
jgi:selenophosphate synthetase-related protein